MRKCACGYYTKRISISEQIHEIQIRSVYNGLSDIGILCSKHPLEFIGFFDWNRLPTAEFDRHYLQSSRDNNIQSRNL